MNKKLSPNNQEIPHKTENFNDSTPFSEGDEVWDILEKASSQKAGDFFARDTVRAVRLMQDEAPKSVFSKLGQFFSLRPAASMAMGATALFCAAAVYLTWSDPQSSSDSGIASAPVERPTLADTQPDSGEMPELAELVIQETLSAAADDPTLLSRDEMVAMLGL